MSAMSQYNFTDETRFEKKFLTQKLKQAIVQVDTNNYGSTDEVPVTESDVESAMQKVDIEGLIDEEKQKYTIQEYDGSGFGGLDDEELRDKNDITGDTAYIIQSQQGKTFFQPFVPYVGGKEPLTNKNWQDVADQHVEKKAREQVFGKVLAKLKNQIDY